MQPAGDTHSLARTHSYRRILKIEFDGGLTAMKRHLRRGWRWLALTFGGATVFQAATTTTPTTPTTPVYPITNQVGTGRGGCVRFATNGILNSVDFCYLLDCQNGFFGGVVDPCNDVSSGGGILLDCGTITTTTNGTDTDGTGTGTTTGSQTTNGTTNGTGTNGFGGFGGF
ncbi:MAG: hypothetical protein AMXMBFR13_40060 [Phycisphaerae bacterium]